MARMSDDEVMTYMRGNGMLNKVRIAFAGEAARIEQAALQSDPPSPMEVRRMEFEAARTIAAVLGITI